MYCDETKQSSPRPLSMSLDQRFYTDEKLYERDVTWLRENMWMTVGHESQIPRSGDYFLYNFDADSIIVIRDGSGEIRAHHNVCRHRGSRICVNATGSVRLLTCPYHAWSYGLDGKLRALPYAANDFDKSLYGLTSCQVRVHCGLIFLSLATNPPDFNAHIGFLTRELELQDVQHSRVVKRHLIGVDANWKLVAQNNLECYHCGPAHPTYCAAHPGVPLGKPKERVHESPYERVRAALPGSAHEIARQFMALGPGFDFRYSARQLIGDGCATESQGGKPLAPLMGQCAYEGVQTLALPSPLTNFVLNPDHAVVYSFTPRAVRRTDIEVIWMVKDTAVEGVDYDIDTLTAVWTPTLNEDKTLAENTQLGVDSTTYRPGPYMPTEVLVSEFDRWYLERIAK